MVMTYQLHSNEHAGLQSGVRQIRGRVFVCTYYVWQHVPCCSDVHISRATLMHNGLLRCSCMRRMVACATPLHSYTCPVSEECFFSMLTRAHCCVQAAPVALVCMTGMCC